jgi:hypothetical protein
MVDHDMKRRPLDGNARSLEPDTQFSEDIVNEALIACVVCKPVHNVAVRMRGDGIDVWRRVHFLLLSSDLGTGYVVSPIDGVNGARRNLLARIGLSVGCRVPGARGRSGTPAILPFNPQLAFGNSKGFRLKMAVGPLRAISGRLDCLFNSSTQSRSAAGLSSEQSFT